MRRATNKDYSAVAQLATAANTYIPNENDDIYLIDFNHKIIAYIVWQKILDEATLLGIAVQEGYRKQGIGRQLIQQSLPAALCFLEVRASNFVAQKLYQSFGFEIIGQRKNYYLNPQEDAILMSLDNRNSKKI